MPRRRELLLGLVAAGALAGARSTPAQRGPRQRRIGYLSLRAGPGPLDEEFRSAMRQLGYVEGRNLTVEYRWAADREDRLPALAAELVHLDVEVIVTSATPAISAAKQATSTIPIVMQTAADPIGSGFATNLARPGANVTGMSILSSELAAKRLQIMQELVPRLQRIGLFAFDNAFATPLLIGAMTTAAEQLRVELVTQLVSAEHQLPGAFASFERAGVQSIIVQTSPFAGARRRKIAELAARHRLPAMYEIPAYVEAGGLIAYGPDTAELFRRSAVFVDRILNGAKAGDLPIEQPSKFELVINLGAAKALGLSLPQSLLARADAVIR